MPIDITGRVMDQHIGKGVPGLQVEAWDRPSTLAHQSYVVPGLHQHSFLEATDTLQIDPGDILIAYVYLDPRNTPSEVMLQWRARTWDHRAYWGKNNIDEGRDGTTTRHYMGALPPAGKWVRLEIPADQVNLEHHTLNGMAFTLCDGGAIWAYAGKATQPDASPADDTVWVEGRLPAGARADTPTGDEGWSWIHADPLPFAESGSTILGKAVTDAHGTFRIEVEETLLGEVFAGRQPTMYFKVFQGDQLIASTEKSFLWRIDDPSADIVIAVEQTVEPSVAPSAMALPHLPLAELAPVVSARPALLARLAEHHITTLGDILVAGGLRDIEGLPAHDPAVRTLEAHANLSILPTDVRTNAQLIERGYTSPVAIASRTRTAFIMSATGALNFTQAEQVYRAAQAQTALLSNVRAGQRADLATGYVTLKGSPRPCECKDCQAAISPLAYLADLLDYTVKNVKRDSIHLRVGSGLAISAWPSGRLDFFARGADNALWHAQYQNGFLSDWESLGGELTSDPAAVAWGEGRIDVFARCTDHPLWHAWFDGSWHSKPIDVEGEQLNSNPAVTSWAPGRLDIFVRRVGGGLLHKSYESGWSTWEPLGGTWWFDPAAVALVPNRLDVFMQDSNKALQHGVFDGAWHWESLGGEGTSSPAVTGWAVSPGQVRLDVFVRGTDHGLWHKSLSGALPSEWEPLGGVLTSSPAVASWEPGRLDVFVRGTDNGLWANHYVSARNRWSGWDSLGRVDLPFLTNTFHQPFSDLPASCEVVDEQVRQVRLCVEVLRSYLSAKRLPVPGSPQETALAKTEKDYRLQAYQTLLARLGILYAELRAARAADLATRQALAARLKINLTEPPPASGDELDRLFLDPAAISPSPHALTEQALERLFGLADTRRDPLAKGAKIGDDHNQITRWHLHGVQWNRNTDIDGMVYLSLWRIPGVLREYQVEVYRDHNRREQVALGTFQLLGGNTDGTVELREVDGSGLSGQIALNYVADSATIAITLIPHILSWRLAHLRTLWHQQDWPSDPYVEVAEGKRPVIDPDVINPDDFRHPIAKANTSDPDQPFDLWIKRREWVDGRLAVFAGLRKNARGQQVPDLEMMLQAMYQNVTYDSTSLAAWTQPSLSGLKELLDNLRGSDKEAAQSAAKTIEKNLRLLVEAFTRLMDIRDKATRWEKSQSDDAVTEAEWSEVHSILAQAQKAAFFTQWIADETQWETVNKRLLFIPQHFWPSLREPREAEWSSALPSPRLDPEVVRLTDLWEPAVRDAVRQPAHLDRALTFWQRRQQELVSISHALQNEYETHGFDAMLRRALGHPNPGDALPYDLDDLKNTLDNGDEKDVKQATSDIENDLYMSVQDFNRLMLVRLKLGNNRKPTKADLDAVSAMLTTAEKRKRRYGTWTNEENDSGSGVRYWQALKGRLPRWRSTSEARQVWRQALSVRSQPPLIDPDVISAGHLRQQIETDDAYRLWKFRTDTIADQVKDLGTKPKTLAGLDTMLEAVVGIGEATVGKLSAKRDQGEGIAAQLAQLNLTTEAFVYLARVRALLVANQTVLDDEWQSVYAILTQVWKQRQFADWRAKEKAVHLILSQDSFQIPEMQVTTFPPPPPPPLPAWRAIWRARQDWEDTLQSRIELEEAIIEELWQVVSETEETVLPRLRDALVLATDAAGNNLAEKARWIAERLLIDAQMDGCQMTTRIAQAIETLLALLWSARLGQLGDLGAQLTLDAPNFDEEWRWIGSYTTWRAAMFVFMYPDNLLLPSLKRQQTPAFHDLLNALRGGRRLTPERARQIAAEYERYWGDVRSLQAVASCYVRVGKDLQPRFFMFAVGSVTNQVYWSACAPQGEQTLWASVPGLVEGSRVIGAIPFTINPERRFIYLFATSNKQDKLKAVFTRYDLVNSRWDDSPLDLGVPQNANVSSLITKQTAADTSPPHLAIMLTNREVQTMEFTSIGGQAEWKQLIPANGTFPGGNFSIDRLQATVEVGQGEFYLFASGGLVGSGLASVEQYFALVDRSGVKSWTYIPDGVYSNFEAAFEWHGTQDVYVFYGSLGPAPNRTWLREYKVIVRPQGASPTLTNAFATNPDWQQIASVHGTPSVDMRATFLVQRTGAQSGLYRSMFAKSGNYSLTEVSLSRVAPRLEQPLAFTEELSEAQLQERRTATQRLHDDNTGGPNTNLVYWAEGCYFVPISIALQLQRVGEYVAALDWFRTVYNFTLPESQRKIYYGLRLEEFLPPSFPDRAADWLLDPLNPHAITVTRRNTYTRYTLLSLIRCLLDYADAEFTRDTTESVPRARILYTTALGLLDTTELKQHVGECEALIGSIDMEVDYPHWVPIAWLPVWNGLVRRLRNIGDAVRLAPAVQQVKAALAENRPWPQFFAEMLRVVTEAESAAPPPPRLAALVENRSLHIEPVYTALLAQPALAETAARVGAMAAFPPLEDGIPLSEIYVPTLTYDFCVPPNPVLKALRLRAELNLYKIRTCRNIAGMERQLEPYAAPTDTESGLSVIGAAVPLVLPGTTVLRPTPYRYSVLIERAKHLVALAQQVETAFLSALEKRDAEAYNLLRARQDIRLAHAEVQLQELRVIEAQNGVTLAKLQRERALLQAFYYQNLLLEPRSVTEKWALDGHMFSVLHLVPGAQASGVAAYWTMEASLERRQQEWQSQKMLALHDVLIGDQQTIINQDHVRVVGQEHVIAVMKTEHAEVAADFLANKFTHTDLYEWMTGVLEEVYSYFLQQATSMAQLANNQLAFERHEVPPPFIQADYWEVPSEDMSSDGAQAPDRRGLTGSARLLRDIYQLDQYAFETNKRKLQLSKTISLSRLAPAEFQRFRETGVMPFGTPMEMFDRDFPGHYLRLIHKVRVSVVALIPPTQGIRATLTTLGLSRVVIGGDNFQTVTVLREPQTIALSSPSNATGLFELDPQSDLLAPFETVGVDTSWEFRMPKAANPFDYRTLADVLVTIEYTALDKFEYRAQVIQALPTSQSADQPFSMRNRFPDQWYDFHNPELQEEGQRTVVRFKTVREDFPPNMEGLRMQRVVIYIARRDGADIPQVALYFSEQGGSGRVGGSAQPNDGLASWTAMSPRSPVGEWEVALPDTEDVRNRFKNDEIDDILLVITYSAETPAWPL